MSDFSELSRSFAERFPQLLDISFMETELRAVCEYALFPPGKCFRAGLCLFVGELLEVEPAQLEPCALALEVLHAASLVHDDLPALDNDTLRRGKATVHRVFGEAAAILAGDALFALSFEQLCRLPEPTVALRLQRLFQRACIALCEGQLLDLQSTEPSGGAAAAALGIEAALCRRHELKTGKLIQAAVLAPSYFIEREPSLEAALERFGTLLGLLFQITDDLLEATSDTAALGKDANSDERQGTLTFVSHFGLAGAEQYADAVQDEALAVLDGQGRLQPLRAVLQLVRARRK